MPLNDSTSHVLPQEQGKREDNGELVAPELLGKNEGEEVK